MINWGKWGGFYLFRGYTKRVCLGFVAITYIPDDIDELLGGEIRKPKK